MTALQHVYVTAHGQFTAGAWVGEKAQIGVRLAIVNEASLPAKGTQFVIGEHGDFAVDTGTTAGTNGILTRAWTARLGPVGSTENADAAWQVDLAEDMRTFLNAIKGYVSSSFSWTHMKIAGVDSAGAYSEYGSATYNLTTALAGTGSGQLPPEVALAVTMRAPVTSRRGRGRFYIPALANNTIIASDGTVNGTPASTILTALQTLVNDLENAPGTEQMSPLVMVTSAGQSTAYRPSQLRVGNHFDAQRRRQHQVTETYTQVNL